MIFLFFLYKLVFLFFSFIPPPEKRIKTFILYLGVKDLEAENEVFFKHFVSISEIHPVFHFWGSKITPVRGNISVSQIHCQSGLSTIPSPSQYALGKTDWGKFPWKINFMRLIKKLNKKIIIYL